MMCKVIAVTNRGMCERPLKDQIGRIAAMERVPDRLILREKDLSEADYELLAEDILGECKKYNIPCILHTYVEVAKHLGCPAIHLSIPVLGQYSRLQEEFETIGVSVHSAEEAVYAQEWGASYLTAGHIYATDCKKDVPPRGIDFLKTICESVKIPVYGIGGMDLSKIPVVMEVKAAGICMMSAYMQ